jgi:PAS domain S-box-containing protein/putative nucleotidyltransferase with HDIG domain
MKVTITSLDERPSTSGTAETRHASARNAGSAEASAGWPLDRLARLAARLVRARSAFVCRAYEDDPDPDRGEDAARLAGCWSRSALGRALIARVMATGEPAAVADARRHPLLGDATEAAALDVAACAGVPLIAPDGRAFGSLWVVDPAPRTWAEADLAALSELADAAMAETVLRRSERQFRALADSTSDWESWFSVEGRVLWVNPAAERQTGCPVEECLAMADYPLPLVHEEDRARVARLLDEARAGSSGHDVELRVSHRDGSTFWAAVSWQPIFAPDGAPMGFRTSVRDITDRKRVEQVLRQARDELEMRVQDRTAELAQINEALQAEITERKRTEVALRESEERFRTAFTEAPVGMVLATPDARFVQVNQAFCNILGYTEQELRTRTFLEITHPDDRENNRRLIGRMLAGEIPSIAIEKRYLAKSGAIVWVQSSVSLLRDGQGRPIHIIGLVQDISERKRAEGEIRSLNARLEHRLERIAALRRIDIAITASFDLRLTLDVVLDQVLTQLRVDAASVLIADSFAQTLEYATGKGFRTTGITRSRLRLGEGCAGRAALERRTFRIDDLTTPETSFVRGPLVAGEGFVTYFAVPLVAKGQVKGVLELFHRAPMTPDPEWLDFLETLAGQAAIAIDNVTMFETMQRANIELTLAYDATIEGWSRALDLRDKETEGHSRRVTEMTIRLARVMGIGGAELVHIRRGALLHDIGKVGIPDAILLKPGPLDDQERAIMQHHANYALELLSPIAFLAPALEIPYSHHEKWDGTGYPRGLKGEQIPLSARIFAIVDIWDALRSDRPYRKEWSDQRVREHLRSLAGTHLDPKVVEVFLDQLASSQE